jgi:hypothetical protein
MPKYHSALGYFVATFQVQCELCGRSFTFEQEFCGKSGIWHSLPQDAKDEAGAAVEEQLARLNSGDYSSVEPVKCPQCGYFQSWMVGSARAKSYFNHFVRWGSLCAIGSMFSLCLLMDWLADRPPPPVCLPWIIVSATVIGGVGLVLSIRKYRQFDPNAEVLQDRPAPTETRRPQVSFRSGRSAY